MASKTSLGALLAHLRNSAVDTDGNRVTQALLSQVTGVSVRVIQQYEAGDVIPPPEYLAAFIIKLRLFGPEITELMELFQAHREKVWREDFWAALRNHYQAERANERYR